MQKLRDSLPDENELHGRNTEFKENLIKVTK